MSVVRFIGCLHLGHEWMATHRGFESSEQHDEYLINQWNSVVNKKDLVYILGDIAMETPKFYYKLNILKGRKKVILGNHDIAKDVPELLKYVEDVSGAISYKGYILTHIPIHPSEVHFTKCNIHAHIHHKNFIPDIYVPERYGTKSKVEYSTVDKYVNVDAHLIDYKPKTLKELNLI